MQQRSFSTRRLLALPLLLTLATGARAQTAGVGIGTSTPHAAAALDITATGKGLLIPRLDSATRAGIGTPPDGLMVFQTDGRKGFWYAMSGSWLFIPDKARSGDNLGNHTATQNLNLAGNQLVGNGSSGLAIDNLGNVGIGTTTPGQKLEVSGNTVVTGSVGIGTGSPTQRLDVDGGILARANGPISNQGAYLQWNRTGGDGETWLLNQKGGGNDNAGIRFGSVTTGNGTTEWARFVDNGSLGLGTTSPSQKLEVAGQVYSSTGGFRFPDNSVQTTAAPTPSLSLTGQTLSIGGGNSVTLPAGSSTGDNLGDHTATQNINLDGNKLVGGTTDRAQRGGLQINGNGLLTLGATRVHPDSTTTYGVRLTDIDQDFVITSRNLRGQSFPNFNVSGAGDRVMWQSYNSSFFAGGVSGNRWDYNHVGRYSAAFGYDNEVRGDFSAAFGANNWVRFGQYTLITGNNNYGLLCDGGFMMGRNNVMRGYNGFCGGFESKVQSNSSTDFNVPSFAFGYRCQARTSTSNVYALGYYARTGGYEGSFVLADFSPWRTDYPADSLVSSNRNEFSARFAGGYRLFTTVATNNRNNGAPIANGGAGMTPVGAYLAPGQSAWQTLSDSTRKERVVLADGNRFLERIGRLRLGSWNYKGQSADSMRHYGPMAQDFYAAFGHDGVGRIGEPTSINQADFDGVNLIAIQALYRRLQALEADNARLRQAEARAGATAEALEARLRALESAVGGQARR